MSHEKDWNPDVASRKSAVVSLSLSRIPILEQELLGSRSAELRNGRRCSFREWKGAQHKSVGPNRDDATVSFSLTNETPDHNALGIRRPGRHTAKIER